MPSSFTKLLSPNFLHQTSPTKRLPSKLPLRTVLIFASDAAESAVGHRRRRKRVGFRGSEYSGHIFYSDRRAAFDAPAVFRQSSLRQATGISCLPCFSCRTRRVKKVAQQPKIGQICKKFIDSVKVIKRYILGFALSATQDKANIGSMQGNSCG